MVDSMEKRRRQAVLGKTRAVCSSMGGLQGGDDEAAESGTEMVVRLFRLSLPLNESNSILGVTLDIGQLWYRSGSLVGCLLTYESPMNHLSIT